MVSLVKKIVYIDISFNNYYEIMWCVHCFIYTLHSVKNWFSDDNKINEYSLFIVKPHNKLNKINK